MFFIPFAISRTLLDAFALLWLYAFMRTTIDIPEDLFREAKTRAVQQGTTLKNLMTQYIRSGLHEQSTASIHPGCRESPPVMIPRTSDTPYNKACSNSDLQALLDEEEIESARSVQESPRS